VKKQMKAGSTLVALEIKGGKEAAFRFLNALQLIAITNNLGDAKSLVTHPTTTTHQRLTPAQRAAPVSVVAPTIRVTVANNVSSAVAVPSLMVKEVAALPVTLPPPPPILGSSWPSAPGALRQLLGA